MFITVFIGPNSCGTPWMSEKFPGTAELLLNSVPVPCVRPSASSPRRSGFDGFKPCHVECEGTEGFK